MTRVQIWLRPRHYSGWYRDKLTDNYSTTKFSYTSMRNILSSLTKNGLSAFLVSLANGQSWISNNIQGRIRFRYQYNKTGCQELSDSRSTISLILLFFYNISWSGTSPGKPILTTTHWETCSQYEEAALFWKDLCISFKFHRSQSWVCKKGKEDYVSVTQLSSSHTSQ